MFPFSSWKHSVLTMEIISALDIEIRWRMGNFSRGAMDHLPKKVSHVAQI